MKAPKTNNLDIWISVDFQGSAATLAPATYSTVSGASLTLVKREAGANPALPPQR